ncbi:hypothetical protein EDC04DRAFT_2894723 [Pisolithus marmoratus]|nr:hypothetical protein EDC04DRAFT_2894723 [Pisolithus marmoratus]
MTLTTGAPRLLELCVVDDVATCLELLNTAKQEDYGGAMREQHAQMGEELLPMYSIVSRKSSEETRAIRQQTLRVKKRDSFPVVIIGNKGFIAFIEMPAKKCINVNGASTNDKSRRRD